ncbi:MAG: hypothetical protein ABWK15_03115 [Dissulfuribacterales bacterium]
MEIPLLVEEVELLSNKLRKLVPLEVEEVDVELVEVEELTPPPKLPELELLEELVEELPDVVGRHTSTPLSKPY